MSDSDRNFLDEAARLFELLHRIAVETMPEEVDFNALAQAKAELMELLGDRREIPIDIVLKRNGIAVHFEGKLEWIP